MQIQQALASAFNNAAAIANIASLVSNTSRPCFEAVGIFSELLANEGFVKAIIKDHKHAVQAVMDHLGSHDKAWQLVALGTCRNLAEAGNTALRTVAEMGGIEKACKLLSNAADSQTRFLAAHVLQATTRESSTRARQAAAAGAVVGLTKLAKARDPTAQLLAMQTIVGIIMLLHPTKLPERQVKLSVEAMVQLLRESSDERIRDTALRVLNSLAVFQSHAGCAAAVQAGAVPLVAAQLVSGSADAKAGAHTLLPWLLPTDKVGLAPVVVAAGGLQACVATLKTRGDSIADFDARTTSASILMYLAQGKLQYAAAIAAAGAVGPYTRVVAETLQRRSLATQLPGLDALLEVGAKQAGVVEEALQAGALPLVVALLQHQDQEVVAAAAGIATSVSAAMGDALGDASGQDEQQQAAVAQLQSLLQPLAQLLQAWLTAAPPNADAPALALLALGNVALCSSPLHAAVSSAGGSQLAASWLSVQQAVPPEGGCASHAAAAQRLQVILSQGYEESSQEHKAVFKLTRSGGWGDADMSKIGNRDPREHCCAAAGCSADCQKQHWKEHKKVCGKPREY